MTHQVQAAAMPWADDKGGWRSRLAGSLRRTVLGGIATAASLVVAGHVAQAQMATIPALLPDARTLPVVPQPGQIIVRLGGHINFYAMNYADSGDNQGGYKQSNYAFADYVHLNPSVDGVAANGLKYGMFVDIWQEKPGNTAVAGQAVGGGAANSITNADRFFGTPYIRRQWVYLGTDKLGTIRLGSGDPIAGLFQTGTFENFNDGGWNGDSPLMFSGNATPTWPFALVGNLYTPSRITYLSPQVFGFEVGASYEPNTSNMTLFDSCNVASTNCARLATSNNPGDLGRRRNMLNIETRYRGVFGGVGVAVEAGWMGSQTVDPGPGIAPTAIRYSGFNQGIGGVTLTYAGLTVGGHLMAGRFNGQWGLTPANAPNSFAYAAGASYTIGPLIAGVQFFHYDSAGNSYMGYGNGVGQLRERGLAAGGTFTLAPGVSLFLDYLWGDRHENGYDLLNNVANTRVNNQVNDQGVGFGTQLRW